MTAGFDDRAFRLLYETSATGFWQVDYEGHTKALNPAMQMMLEVSGIEELDGKTFHQFFTPESNEKIRVEYGKRLSGLASTYEVELVGVRGTHRHVVLSGVPVLDEAGQLVGRFASLTDVSEAKRAEAALRSREKQLRSLFAASIDAIGVSRNGVHLLVNPAYVRMFGAASEAELEGTSILDLIAPAQRPEIIDRVRRRTAGEVGVNHYVTRGLRRDGREFPMEVQVSSYEDNGAVHTVVILRDITDRLALEDQLRQSQKMDALGRLAGGVAHDFNNLLTVIMSCADLALRALPADSAPADNVQLIRSTGERAAMLTRQLLALSRRQVIDPKVTDLNSIVGDLATMLRRLLGSHISLVVDAEPALAPVRVDAGQFQQVIMNLCLNGRDAMPDGGKLEVRTRNVDLDDRRPPALVVAKAGHYVVVSVSDNGHGMSAEVQSRLFEPFFTTKPPGQGTGLGLSTVYGIVKQSGGHITVDTSVGHGSTFHVYLPAAEAPECVVPPVQSQTAAASGTILLAEDEPSLRAIIHSFLGRLGYQMLVASNGDEALALFTDNRDAINIVVTDMMMPGLTGVELMKAIDAVKPNIRALIMSGYAVDGELVMTSRPGAAFIAKPFTLPDLADRIAELLSSERLLGAERR